MGGQAYISRDGNGRVKLEYSKENGQFAKLWETREGRTLETLFDSNGSILMQRMIEAGQSEMQQIVDQALRDEQLEAAQEKAYEHVKLKKPCPKCGDSSLARYADIFASMREVPIMPLYRCSSCKTTSYNMTDTYLQYLVENSRELFDGAEIKEFENNKEAFMAELRGYIIRIFASKRVMCID